MTNKKNKQNNSSLVKLIKYINNHTQEIARFIYKKSSQNQSLRKIFKFCLNMFYLH